MTTEISKEVQDVLEAMAAYLGGAVQERQPGDMDRYQIAQYFGCSMETVRTKLQPALDAGVFKLITVLDPKTGKKVNVYRKV